MLRLPLGFDCLKMLEEHFDVLQKTLHEFDDVARSTDTASWKSYSCNFLTVPGLK